MKGWTFELMVDVVLFILYRYCVILSSMQPGLTLSFLPVLQRRRLRDPLTICIANMNPLLPTPSDENETVNECSRQHINAVEIENRSSNLAIPVRR
jgi:hypothetical protein